jgi:hypothetical protein
MRLRHGVAALVVAFMIGTIGGAAGLLGGGDDGSNGTAIQFRPESDELEAAASSTAKKKAEPKGEFTTEAVKEKDGRITLSGQAEGVKPGSRLTVQRKQGSGWSDFPAGTKVDPDGSYSLWIKTSRSGSYRVKDEESGAASKPVNVKV